MIEIVVIRHFKTEGNLEKRYIGVTDEPLCQKGIDSLSQMQYPKVEAVFASPMLRCRQTAKLIYPSRDFIMEEKLAECNFGDFENKNYIELQGNPNYEKWVKSEGKLAFPNGESKEIFHRRTIDGFQNVISICLSKSYHSIAMVVHGGTIMSILSEYSYPHQDFYHWQVENGHGYTMNLEKDGRLTKICSIPPLH